MIKRKVLRAILAVLPVLLMAVLWLVSKYVPERAAHILARYPQSMAFDYVVKDHLEWKPPMGNPQATMFFATWFMEQKPERQMSAGIGGWRQLFWITTPRSIYPISSQGEGKVVPLTNTEFLKFREYPKHFPRSSPPLQQGDLLIVTFNNANGHDTRVYDRKHVPASVFEAIRLTQAPLDDLRVE